MIGDLVRLYWEFFQTGLFAVGGGMATLPFLRNIGETTGWYTYGDLMNMLAVSESTPGPIGINMATYVGFTVAGIPGALTATLGEVTPSIIVILIVAAMLNRFRDSELVSRAFYGLRPASTGLIGAACVSVILETLTGLRLAAPESGVINRLVVSAGEILNVRGIVLAAFLFGLMNFVQPAKKLHPAAFIGISAAVGVIFRFSGA